jgi:hypothetical protein
MSRMCPHCITMAVTERRGGCGAQLGTLNLGLSLEVGVRACAQANPSISCDEFQNVKAEPKYNEFVFTLG